MSAGSAREGARPLTRSRSIRILSTQFTITSNRPELIERLPYVAQCADQDLPLKEHCDISVMWDDGEYLISGGGAPDECELSLEIAFSNLFSRLHDHSMLHYADHTRIHAASGFGPRGLVLLVGEKTAGKSTLATHLLLEGFEMVGDELVLLKDGEAITFPRNFYLRTGFADLLPKLAHPALANPPFVSSEAAGKLIAVDPKTLGYPWSIRPAAVQALVVLQPNHGRPTQLQPCSKVEMVRQVLPQSSPPSSGRRDWLADMCKTIDGADTVVAQMGDLSSATPLFKRLITG